MNATEKKAAAKAKRELAAQVKLGEELAAIAYEAWLTEAYAINELKNQALLTHKEICAQRRASAYETTSIFTKSINPGSSCYNLELLLTTFHTENELFKLMNEAAMLAKCGTPKVTRSRIRSHISHLRRKFVNTVKYVEKVEGSRVFLKFELK